MDKKQITALVQLDLSKAFDSIDHVRLLHKLSITPGPDKVGKCPPVPRGASVVLILVVLVQLL